MNTGHAGRNSVEIVEAGSPHQRAVAENPKMITAVIQLNGLVYLCMEFAKAWAYQVRQMCAMDEMS